MKYPTICLTGGIAQPRRVARHMPFTGRVIRHSALFSAAALVLPRSLAAHAGRPIAPHDLPTAWTLDPIILASIALPAWLYFRGTRRLWTHAGKGRGVKRWQLWCGAAGFTALSIALISPLGELGGALFSAHMAQHQLLMIVAAPLLVLGAPMVGAIWAFEKGGRRTIGRIGRQIARSGVWRALTHPVVAWTLHAAAIWFWHMPRFYEQTLRSELVHGLQHFSFFASAMLFWWSVVNPRDRAAHGYGIGVISVFSTAVHGSLLGALMTFAAHPWYPAYAGRVEPWGFTLLEDQQLGGLIMWVPAGFIYTAAALMLFAAWLRALENRPDFPRARAPA